MSNTYWDGETWPPPPDKTPAEVLTVLHYRILALESALKMLNRAQKDYESHVPVEDWHGKAGQVE
jgi:hypothetical protein